MLVSAVLAGALVLVDATPAAACSCDGDSLRQRIERSDAAFVGTPTAITPHDDDSVEVTFRVEQLVKGASSGTTVLLADRPTDNDCGGGRLAEGRLTGRRLLVVVDERKGQHWAADGCGPPYDADLLADVFGLPPPPSTDPQALARVVVGGDYGWGRLAVLDENGRAVAYGLEPGEAYLLSVCPDGESVLEAVYDDGDLRLAWRDLTTMQIVHETSIGGPLLRRMTCLGPPDIGAVVASQIAGEIKIVSTHGTSVHRTRVADPAFAVDLANEVVYLGDAGVWRIDLDSGDRTLLIESRGRDSLAVGVELDTSGTLLGVWYTTGPVVYDLATGRTQGRVPPETEWTRRLPASDDDLVDWHLGQRDDHLGQAVPTRLDATNGTTGATVISVESPVTGTAALVEPIEVDLEARRAPEPVALPLPGDELPTSVASTGGSSVPWVALGLVLVILLGLAAWITHLRRVRAS
ncbi:MAG: hypothetical protein KDB21_12240 [Acidimicrobiales bacterium]|nr:hypothetical protein [Acidimicrobiales bacterium]